MGSYQPGKPYPIHESPRWLERGNYNHNGNKTKNKQNIRTTPKTRKPKPNTKR